MNGKHLQTLREKNELSRQNVANKLGVTYGFIARIENDTAGLSIENLAKLARIYNTTTDSILGLDKTFKTVKHNDTISLLNLIPHVDECDGAIINSLEKERSKNDEARRETYDYLIKIWAKKYGPPFKEIILEMYYEE